MRKQGQTFILELNSELIPRSILNPGEPPLCVTMGELLKPLMLHVPLTFQGLLFNMQKS